jgi:hypothetical protein
LGLAIISESTNVVNNIITFSKDANQVFDDLPPLPDPTAEEERQQILNYCFSLDVNLVSKYLLYDDNLKKIMKKLQ